MKPFSVHPASCSCTSCVYRSRSKEPKVQRIIQGGTEIDKLYYGKFLPLRERKLLEKLIRTRDVYDEVRNQLLSSSSSDQTSLEHKRKRRDDDKSSAVLKMVDLVDRRQMGSANTSKFSSCCSCCSCETLRKIRKRMEKDKHKHPRVHRHIVTCEDIAKYCAEAEERGRKRRNKLSTKISSKLSSKIREARLKMKKNLSEPCACTLSLSSMATRSSKPFKKIRSKKKATESAQARKFVTIDQETKISKLQRKPRKRVKNIQSSTTKDSGSEVKNLKVFKIKKDSILLFKEKLLKKRTYEENQDVECKPGICNTDECIPEECLKKIKAKGVGDTRKRKYHTRHSETGRDRFHTSMSSRTKKVKVRDSQVQDSPSPTFSHSMISILKTKVMPSFSKSEIKGKRPVSPKQRQQFEKGTGKHDKDYKTTASMTSIPKSKAKAQLARKEEKVAPKAKPKAKLQVVAKDKRLEEKGIRVKVSPQTNLVSCECNPSTKSTSSLTSVPKQKASKSGSKRIKSHEVTSPPIRHKKGRQKPRRESYQKEVDSEEPIEHDKTRREKRMRPTHDRIKQRREHKYSNTQFTGTLSKASQESYLRESASQANDLPFPRECEPLMCIPYECDPEKCAEILLSRSKSRGKSVVTSMDRLRRKSVGSAAFSQKTSQKTSSKSRTKSKHKQSKSAENFIRKPKYVSKDPPPQIVEQCSYPDRQAVKITSSFSFDIEFYKDKYPCVKDDKKKGSVSGHQKKIKQKEQRRKYKDHVTGYISSRQNISSQSRSSQSLKNIQVGHRLKRCFCTLKLLPKKKQKLKHAVSKRTMASFHNKELDMRPLKKRKQTKPSGVAYVVPPATPIQASLLPYECEPFFCTPGECNPYECAERIKQRNRRAGVSKDTNTTVTPKKSKLASTSQSESKSTSRPIYSCDCENRNINSGDKSERYDNRNIKHKGRHSPSSNVESKVSGDKSETQAVRLGSNINFNIEFSKTNINDQECADALKSDKLIKRERRHLQEKGIKAYKPHVRHETSETNKYDKTKQTYNEPFLQRCLCTLKFLKKNKKKVETLSPWRNRHEYVMHMQKKSVITNRADIRYNPKRSKLLPYEWEPGLCLPKECDPYNCEKLIKLRQMILQHKYSNTFSGDLGSRSTFSKTSRTVTSKSRDTQSFTKECPQKVQKRNQDCNKINIIPSRSKQRVKRVRSKSSLKMSRYKSKDNFITTKDLINKYTHNKGKLNTIGSQQFRRPAHQRDAEAKRKEKGSYVLSAIKRCFSTLKFQKKKNKTCEYQSTRTRLSKLPYGLSCYKYAPNFSVPGICDPYECYEKSKRREIKGLHDLYVSRERRERKSFMSVTTSDFSGSTMANSTKSRLLKHKSKKHQKVRDKQRDIKAARSFSTSRQIARKISKSRFVPSIRGTAIKNRVEKYNTVSEISMVSRIRDKGTKNRRVALKHDLSQANEIRKEVKASKIGFLLKRCFCTLGLQKKNKSNQPITTQSITTQPITTQPITTQPITTQLITTQPITTQPITTQFVQVEQNRHNITKSGCKGLNKTMFEGEPLKLKLPASDDLFREKCIGNQVAKNLSSSRSFSRRTHVRSRVEFNFDKMRRLLNTQKSIPFYRSFYALNVKVSKSKNIPHNKYRALGDNECRPGDCLPNKCDPVDCSKKIKRLKRSKGSDTSSLNSHYSQASYYKRFKTRLEKEKKKRPTVTLGSDLTIRAGVYKDKNPYKNPRCQALRLGSDFRVNFNFFKDPPSRGAYRTGTIPYHDREEATRRHPEPDDLQPYGETQSKVTGISHMIRRCFCAAKLKNATKSDIYQNSDVTRAVKDYPRYKSTTRLSLGSEKRERNLISKSFQDNDYSQQQRKKSHRRTDRNNVTFCTDVNCLEFVTEQTPRQTKLNRVQERGEGDFEKKKGSIAENHSFQKSNSEKKDKKKIINFIEKCYCTLKHLKGQKGKQLSTNQSEEIIENKKKYKQLDEAEREMETIMPYSKKKFKKLDSQSKIAQDPNLITKQNKLKFGRVQATNEITTGKRTEKSGSGLRNTCFCPKLTSSFKCLCYEKEKKKRTKGTEEQGGKRKPKMPAGPVVDNKPLFEMMLNKTNMRIVNRDEVLKNLGSSGKESKAMKKARAAINQGNVDPPVMKMIIDSKNASLVNSDQVIKQMNTKRKTKARGQAEKKTRAPEPATLTKKSIKKEHGAVVKSHGKKCKCCYCRGKKKGKSPIGAKFSIHTQKLRPCICGSILCKKDWNRIYQEQKSMGAIKIKKCVCGSDICKEESSKMPELLLEGMRQAERDRDLAKRAKAKEKLYQKARKKRAKKHKEIFKKESKTRRKQDKRQMKSIKRSENMGDISLMAESFIDLGGFGSKAFCDISRTMYRAVLHPRDAYHNVREAVKAPGAAAKSLHERAIGWGLFAVLARIRQRVLKMPLTKDTVKTMEAHPSTNYLIHIADKDSKKRMAKIKTKRKREPLDFQCSLYMASMRRRPCLRIYYMCPWFYPHCMSLLNGWKQLMDILLFILAVAVWSPCILCLELCRGCVCCCLCQA